MNFCIKSIILFFTYLSFNVYANTINSSLVPVEVSFNKFLLLNRDGLPISPPTSNNNSYSMITYDPLLDSWNAVREEKILWSTITSHEKVTYFFDHNGQFIKNTGLITYLGEGRYLLSAIRDNDNILGHYYLLDEKHNIIAKLDPEFREFKDLFSNNLIIAKTRLGKYGYINRSGKWQIPPIYNIANTFNGEYAQVTYNNDHYVIDSKNNQIIIDTTFQREAPLSHGYWLTYTTLSEPNKEGNNYTTEIRGPNNELIISNQDVTLSPVAKDIFMMKDLETRTIIRFFDTRTGNLIIYPDDIVLQNRSYLGPLPEDNFWVYVIKPNRADSLYRLLDRKGNPLFEGQFDDVRDFYGQYAWVKLKGQPDWQLINIEGKVVSDSYDRVKVKQFGKKIYTYAEKNEIKYVLDADGSILFYNQYAGNYLSEEKDDTQEDNESSNALAKDNPYRCIKSYTYLIFNAKHEIVWPLIQDAKQQCFINQPYSETIDEQKLRYLQATIDYKQQQYSGAKSANQRVKKSIQGPAIVNLNNIAEIDLPDGYVYFEQIMRPKDQFAKEACQHSIIPKYNHQWRLCINLDDIGHVGEKALYTFVQQEPQSVTQQILDRNIKGKGEKVFFEWQQPLQFDNKNHILSWDYHYIDYNEYFKSNIVAYRNASSLQFGRDHVIWLTNMDYFDTQYLAPQLAQWQQRIRFKPGYQYQDSTINCERFPLQDKDIYLKYYDYQPEQRCYTYSLDRFINIAHYLKNDAIIAIQSISKNAKPNEYIIINQQKENRYGYY